MINTYIMKRVTKFRAETAAATPILPAAKTLSSLVASSRVTESKFVR